MAMNAQSTWQPIPFERPQAPPQPQPLAPEEVFPVSAESPSDRFAMRQLGALVQKVYLAGHRGGHKYVVFSSLENSGVRPWLSARIGELLSQQVAESVCLVEVDPNARVSFELAAQYPAPPHSEGSDLTYKAGRNLWVCPSERFLRADAWSPRSDLMRLRLGRLRREFGFLVIHAPALDAGDEAVLLSQLAEGLVLVLEANVSRRAAAIRASQMLHASGVSLLGTILDQRTFPVPESLYRRV